MQPEIPVVVVGGNLNALGVVRSLAHSRIPTYVLSTTRNCPAAWSRHATYVRAKSLQGEPLIEALVALAKKLRCRPVLILTQDASVHTVSAQRRRLKHCYRVEMPDPGVVETLSDKLAFDVLASREGFAVPRSCPVRIPEDIEQINALLPPVILKPADKGRVTAGAADRAIRAETLEQARAQAQEMLRQVPAVIVQEWIEGPDSEIFFTFFCAHGDGTPAAFFSGRKLQSTPPGVGSTAICIPAPEFAEALEYETRRFLERVPYRGLGSLEFKRDVRNGRFLMVEPTVGRTDWQEEIAALDGVNLPAIAYWIALGVAPPSAPIAHAQRRPAWRADFQFKLPVGFRENLRIVDAHFRWNDPLPGMYYYLHYRGVRRIWRRIRRIHRTIFKAHQRLP